MYQIEYRDLTDEERAALNLRWRSQTIWPGVTASVAVPVLVVLAFAGWLTGHLIPLLLAGLVASVCFALAGANSERQTKQTAAEGRQDWGRAVTVTFELEAASRLVDRHGQCRGVVLDPGGGDLLYLSPDRTPGLITKYGFPHRRFRWTLSSAGSATGHPFVSYEALGEPLTPVDYVLSRDVEDRLGVTHIRHGWLVHGDMREIERLLCQPVDMLGLGCKLPSP